MVDTSFSSVFSKHLLPEYIITHAPVAPWFTPGRYRNGAYTTVNQQVGNLIDWYNIQFYNRKHNDYCKLAVTVPSSRISLQRVSMSIPPATVSSGLHLRPGPRPPSLS